MSILPSISSYPAHILAAPTHPDPYPYYATLVAGPPLVFDAPRRLWIASSAAAVRQVLCNPACRVRPLAEPVPKMLVGSAAGELFGYLVRMNDGDRHAAPKLALQRFLAGLDLARVQATTQELALRLTKGRPLSGATLTQWAFDMPVMAVAALLGVDEAGLAQIAGWMADFAACLSPLGSEAQLSAASLAAQGLMARFDQLLRSTPARSGSAVERLRAEVAQAGWNDAQALRCNLVGLLSQTYEATAGLLGNSLVALAMQPGLWEAVTGEPGMLLDVVQEVSRHDPPIHNTRRFVAQATHIAGIALQAGDAILLVLAAAGRDPSCNPRPNDFLLARSERTVPGFGHGMHQCPGRALACTIAASALDALLMAGRLPSVSLGSWHYRPSMNARIPVFND